MKILMKIGFLGTNYSGYQVQPNAITVQGTLQDAIERIFGKKYPLTGCSRTDSGVHANEFFCTVELDDYTGSLTNNVARIPAAMNSVLPADISVFDVKRVDDSFHVRYNVKYKEYEYLIWNRRTKNPFYADRAYHYPHPLNISKMVEAAEFFCGRHDFSSFMSSGSSVEDTVREIKYCIINEDNGFIKIKIAADGFLYNMVRIITGTLIAVSENKISPKYINEIIIAQNRKLAGPTAPAHGLYLNKVIFKED